MFDWVKPNWWEINPRDGFGADPFYEDQLQRTYFLSGFDRKDILYFYNRLNEIRLQDMAPDAIADYLYRELYQWKNMERTRSLSPLEPFLFALKLKGGILADMYGVLSIDTIDAVARVLLHFWDTKNERDLDIVRHALFYWSWPQSRAVIIRMYTLEVGFSDEQIDKLVRHRLYSADEAELACQCLLAHPSPDNEEALLKFFSKLNHTTSFGVEINTRPMRTSFESYCGHLSVAAKEDLFDLYSAKYAMGADKAGRIFLEKLLTKQADFPLNPLFTGYAAADAQKKEEILDVIRREWDLSDWSGQYLCRYVNQPELLNILQNRLSNTFGISCANSLHQLALAQYGPANEYILDTQKRLRMRDPQWMEFSLASNLISGTPSWDDLMEAFFIERIGRNCKQTIQKRIRSSRDRKYFRKGEPTDKDAVTEALARIANTLAIPPQNKFQRNRLTEFFTSARFFFTRPFCEDFFPQELYPVLKQAFDYSMEQDSILLSTLLDLIDSLVNRWNRSVYYPMLQDLYNNGTLPNNLRLRAHKIIYRIFRTS